MRIMVTSDVVEKEHDGDPVGKDLVMSYIDVSDHTLVPGVKSWKDVVITHPDPTTIIVEATLDVEDVVSSGDFVGQEVSEAWISGYILGADVYWLVPGALKATDVQFP